MHGRVHRGKRRSNISILSQTLREVAREENLRKEPPKVQQIAIEPKQSKPKASKREIGIEGNGIIEKQLTKKGVQFINFKTLLTS